MAARYSHTIQLPADLEHGVIRLMQDRQLSFNALIVTLIRDEMALRGLDSGREET